MSKKSTEISSVGDIHEIELCSFPITILSTNATKDFNKTMRDRGECIFEFSLKFNEWKVEIMDQVKPNSLDEDALERNTGIKQPANTGVKNVANIGLQHPLLRDISCIERGLALHSGKSLLVLQAKALHLRIIN